MRNFIQLIESLSEDTKKQKEAKPSADGARYKDAEAELNFDIDDGSSKGDLAAPKSSNVSGGPRPGSVSRGAAPVRGSLDATHLNYLDALMNNQDLAAGEEEIPTPTPTAGVEVVPVTPDNLPAVIQTAIARTDGEEPGVPTFNPTWRMVRDLPGYMATPIRSLGKMIFSQFTDISIEDINVMAAPFINTKRDLDMMAHWIRRYGVRDDEAEMDFSQIMPGYAAKTQIWNAEGYTFMLVLDEMGQYIYSWPGGRGVHLDAPTQNPQLREYEDDVQESAFDDGFDDAKRETPVAADRYAAGTDDAGDYADGYDISKSLDDKAVNLHEGISRFSDNEGNWYVQVSRNGHISATHGPFPEDESKTVASDLEAYEPSSEHSLGGGPWDMFRESRDDDIQHILGQVQTHDPLSNPWGIAFNESEDDFMAGNKPIAESAPQPRKAMTEAQTLAALAGIGAKPKAATGTPEALQVASDMAALAGIRR